MPYTDLFHINLNAKVTLNLHICKVIANNSNMCFKPRKHPQLHTARIRQPALSSSL